MWNRDFTFFLFVLLFWVQHENLVREAKCFLKRYVVMAVSLFIERFLPLDKDYLPKCFLLERFHARLCLNLWIPA
jgi:hypothetical protein